MDDETSKGASVPGPRPRSRLVGPLMLLAVTGMWIVLASRNPTSTYHFAPLVAVLTWPLINRNELRTLDTLTLASGWSLALVVSVAIVLQATGRLDGPVFWGDGSGVLYAPALEAVLLAAVGSVLWVFRMSKRLPVSAEQSSD